MKSMCMKEKNSVLNAFSFQILLQLQQFKWVILAGTVSSTQTLCAFFVSKTSKNFFVNTNVLTLPAPNPTLKKQMRCILKKICYHSE